VQLGDFGASMSAQAMASEDAAWSKNSQFVPLPKAVLPEVRQNRQTRDEKLFAKIQPAEAFREALTSRYRRLKISAVFSGRRWLRTNKANTTARLVITNRAATTKMFGFKLLLRSDEIVSFHSGAEKRYARFFPTRS
jgi:hypothetical protein